MIACRGRLPRAFARTLAARGFRRATPVQRAVLRVEDPTADMLVSACAGSGKTVAFGLALARRLVGADGRFAAAAGPRALVIAPTREIAHQVRAELGWLFSGTGVRLGCVTGGADPTAERAALARGLDLVVGTPGRLRDHLAQGTLDAGSVASVVLDEADQMLARDFREELEAILGALPSERQILMFSATVGEEAERLAARFQPAALRMDLAAQNRPEAVVLQGVAVAPGDREAAVVNLLRLHEARAAMVFCGRREAVAHMAQRLAVRGFEVATLSGALSQRTRNTAISAMREGRARICVATDLAARGVDLPGLDLVLHADLPGSAEILLHRSGRTGRAGRSGLAILLVPRAKRRRAEALAARAGLAIEWIEAPDRAEVLARDLERMLAEARTGEVDQEEAALSASLVARLGADRVAHAYRRLWSATRPAPVALNGGATLRRRGRRSPAV